MMFRAKLGFDYVNCCTHTQEKHTHTHHQPEQTCQVVAPAVQYLTNTQLNRKVQLSRVNFELAVRAVVATIHQTCQVVAPAVQH
jgi:hypothetical protein